MSFSATEVTTLAENIRAAGLGRSLSAHKGDVQKFILAHFAKLAKSTTKAKSTSPPAKKKTPDATEKKTAKKTKKSPPREKKSGDKRQFSVKEVNGKKYQFKTNYKSETTSAAAEKAAKAICKKNNLTDTEFTFVLQEKEGRTWPYKYSPSDGVTSGR